VTVAGVTLLVACVDTVLGALLLWLLIVKVNGRLTMPIGDRRRERLADRDDRDWRARRGHYAGLDPDTPDRPQVKPVGLPPVERRTHNLADDGIREREDFLGGPWQAGDDDGD
jgi:hypothetical protein